MRVHLVALCLLCHVASLAEAGGSEPRAGIVNVAVDAAASASSETADHPALFATDGNAATTWCPVTSPGTLTIDLGRTQGVSGFGISIAGAVATGTVEISVATSLNAFHTLVPSQAVSTSAPTWVDRDRVR